jgi:hypothetical protein
MLSIETSQKANVAFRSAKGFLVCRKPFAERKTMRSPAQIGEGRLSLGQGISPLLETFRGAKGDIEKWEDLHALGRILACLASPTRVCSRA